MALAATLHDASGALRHDVERLLPRLQALYRGVAVATSPPTDARVTALLARAGVHAGTPPSNQRGPLYRLALRRALAAGAPRVHYVDFDRALHWVRRAPRELAAVLRAARRHPVLVLGRTEKAHRSHHVPLYATEAVANRLLAGRLGLVGRIDLLVPSFVATDALVTRLLARSRARDAAVYGEWAALIVGLAREIAYLECRGLDWETPDRHRRAVRRAGLAAWRSRWATAAEWDLRIDIASATLTGATRALAHAPRARPVLRRLAPRAG
ncbi:MAG: hypothetical protein E6J70_12870 [Deltaproteobacteria bacterium]|nr:MAG: hypothetical protein E6J70_12870 [Deltaproteobacteria bacterium]